MLSLLTLAAVGTVGCSWLVGVSEDPVVYDSEAGDGPDAEASEGGADEAGD